MYLNEIEEKKEKSRKELEDLSGEDHIFMESIIDDKTDIIPEDQYIPKIFQILNY